MTETNNPESISIGLDDGYAYTKLALPDGRLLVIPSRARVGRANVTWLNEAQHKIAEYETEDTLYAAGEVDGEPTYFDGYPFSGLNRVIVQHALQQAKLDGHSVHAVSGLPVSAFYLKDGSQRMETVEKKRASLKQSVSPIDGRLSASIAFHDVIPEALAAWYDHVITDHGGQVTLVEERLSAPIAVVDIGGRTTDYVVVADQAVV
ncbi:MAG: ParM/StbA family protein, partial [Sulfitobacter sp.]|nr:ParM/StbA family protein [Sulfitobacter sp.]